jgi:serine/threonine protein phosphatase PrpC
LEEGYTSLRLVAAGQSHPGLRRPLNEDSWQIAQAAETGAMWPDRGRLFAVADGMGGHAAGEVASRVAIETLFSVYYDRERDGPLPPTMRLQEAIDAANHAVYGQSATHDTQAGMGTTIVAAVVRDDWLIVANVGDSRAYLLRGGQAMQITQDHSWVAEQVAAGVLSNQEAENHIYKNVVTRCLGHRPTIQVDLFEHALQVGDAVLLCSDGLSNQVSGDEMVRALAQSPLRKAADQMIALANERGGPDNITVVLFKMFDPADAAGARLAESRIPAGVQRSTRTSPLGGVAEPQPTMPRALVRKAKARFSVGFVVLLVAFIAVACGALLLVAATRIEDIRNLLLSPSPTLPALITATPQVETATAAVTETIAAVATGTATPQDTNTPSATATETATPQDTDTPSAMATETSTATATATTTLTPTYTITPLPTDTLTPTLTPTGTPTRTPFPTSGPQPTQG